MMELNTSNLNKQNNLTDKICFGILLFCFENSFKEPIFERKITEYIPMRKTIQGKRQKRT